MTERNIINQRTRLALGNYKGQNYQTFSGIGIKAVMYLPLMTLGSALDSTRPRIKTFGDLQTITISSTRSISPVRVFGRPNAIAYTRGAITYAGSMVFATINREAFSDILDTDLGESSLNSKQTLIAHQLPPFSIVLTATNETGGAGIQIINGITITNYGTVHSIDDLYSETTYSYIATDVTPFLEAPIHDPFAEGFDEYVQAAKTVTQVVASALSQAYGSASQLFTTIQNKQRYKDLFPVNERGNPQYTFNKLR